MKGRILEAAGKYDYHDIQIHHFIRKDSKEKSRKVTYTWLRETVKIRRRNNENKA